MYRYDVVVIFAYDVARIVSRAAEVMPGIEVDHYLGAVPEIGVVSVPIAFNGLKMVVEYELAVVLLGEGCYAFGRLLAQLRRDADGTYGAACRKYVIELCIGHRG